MYERAKSVLDALLSTEEELGAVQGELKGPLRMCMPNEAPRLLAPILAEFCSLQPGIELECDTRLTGLEVLREDMDLSIVFHRGRQDDSAFITRELATLPSIVVASPALLAQTGTPRHVRDLKSLPCITTLSALKGQPWQFLDPAGEIVKVPVRSRYRVNSGGTCGGGRAPGPWLRDRCSPPMPGRSCRGPLARSAIGSKPCTPAIARRLQSPSFGHCAGPGLTGVHPGAVAGVRGQVNVRQSATRWRGNLPNQLFRELLSLQTPAARSR